MHRRGKQRKINLILIPPVYFLSFPKADIGFLAYLMPPLLIRARIIEVFIAGILSNMLLMYWIVSVFYYAGESIILGVIALLLLSAYISIYWVLWKLITAGLKMNTLSTFYSSIVWTLLEVLRSYLFTGIPWGLLGLTQWKNPLAAIVAGISGVYGMSFFVFFCGCILHIIISRKKFLLFFPVYTILAVLNFIKTEYKEGSLNVAILQGNIDQYKKWDPEYRNQIIETYKNLYSSINKDTFLVVLPEAAMPDYLQSKPVKQFIKTLKTPALIGVLRHDGETYNSAVLIEGATTYIYDKSKPLPFGEYVPFDFLRKLGITTLSEMGDIREGELKTIKNLGVFICSESMFTHIPVKLVNMGAEVLINITNDGWFKDTSEPYQHLQHSVFRAMETGRFLVRATNTGISCIIAPNGRIIKKSSYGISGVITGGVEFINKKTFYTQHMYKLLFTMCGVFILFTILLKSFVN